MPYSGLVSGIVPSPWFTKLETKKIDSVAIHAMSSNMSAENCGYWFQTGELEEVDSKGNKTGKKVQVKASSNYGIGSDGQIYGYVDELDYAWTTSSSGVDCRAVTIEVANTTPYEPYECTKAAYDALIKLLADICKRYNMTLKWKNDKAYALRAAAGGPVTEQNMFVHRWFADKPCPGTYLFDLHSQIASDVNTLLRRGFKKIPTIDYDGGSFGSKSTCIFIGDSRTVGMKQYVDPPGQKHIWSCAGGMGLVWMKSTGVPNIESRISSDTAVCILMGVNDLMPENVESLATRYVQYINECANRWVQKGAAVYFVSVNPVVDGKYGGPLKNSDIQRFNQNVRNGLNSNVGYIDTFSLIIDNFSTIDGLHYTGETYKEIYNIILSAAKGGRVSKFHNSAMIGGLEIDIDYTKLNPYVITLDRKTDTDRIDWDEFQTNGIVGAVVEYGALFDEYHKKYSTFKQPKFDEEKKLLDEHNLEYGYLIVSRARSLEEAKSELNSCISILRTKPPRLGVWLQPSLKSNSNSTNDSIIEWYQTVLINLGFKRKLGLYSDVDGFDKFSWDKFQEEWILWLDKHVEDESDLAQLFTPTFFDPYYDETTDLRDI